MAKSRSNDDILELHIQCRVCAKKFHSLLPSDHKDITIRCPFCSNFALAIIDEFYLRPEIEAFGKVIDGADKKRKYRI